MSAETKMKIRKLGKLVEVMVLVKHPMGSGAAKGKAGSKPDFIETMSFHLNNKPIAQVYLSPQVADNPMACIQIEDYTPGDVVKVQWKDTKGKQGGSEAALK